MRPTLYTYRIAAGIVAILAGLSMTCGRSKADRPAPKEANNTMSKTAVTPDYIHLYDYSHAGMERRHLIALNTDHLNAIRAAIGMTRRFDMARTDAEAVSLKQVEDALGAMDTQADRQDELTASFAEDDALVEASVDAEILRLHSVGNRPYYIAQEIAREFGAVGTAYVNRVIERGSSARSAQAPGSVESALAAPVTTDGPWLVRYEQGFGGDHIVERRFPTYQDAVKWARQAGVFPLVSICRVTEPMEASNR